MPFVVPPSTRGLSRGQKPLYEVLLTRLGDLIAGPGLEQYRVDLDLKQEAEEMLPSARPVSSPPPPPSASAAEDDDVVASSSLSAAASDTARLVIIPASSPDEKVIVNKFGAHFVYIPSLGRYVARADRKTVRASAIGGRIVFSMQLLFTLIGLYCLLLRTVDCAPISADGASTTATVTTTRHPGWENIAHGKSVAFTFAFFAMLLGGSVFQGFLVRSGDKSAGNPGFMSVDGDEFLPQITLPSSPADGDAGPTVLALQPELRRSCKTCGIAQPLRCRHCRSCGRCVPRSDHHCYFLGGVCVGSFNYGAFVLVVLDMAIAATMGLDLLCGAWLDVYRECGVPGSPKAGWIHRQLHANGLLLVVIVVTVIACILLWVLFCSHLMFTITEQTTYEFARPGKNSHMRYYACTSAADHPAAPVPVRRATAPSVPINLSMSSPFSNPNVLTNFTALWWYFGLRSVRRRFRRYLPAACIAYGRDDERQQLEMRCGSPDGINFFVSTATPQSQPTEASDVV